MPIALDRSHPESRKFRDSRTPLRVARFSLPVIALLLPNPAFAQTCDVNMTAVERPIADLEGNYSLVLSDIGCEAPTKKAHQLMCDAALDPQSNLWRIRRLDDLAWVYAYENATGTQIDQENPPGIQILSRNGTRAPMKLACALPFANTPTIPWAELRPTTSHEAQRTGASRRL